MPAFEVFESETYQGLRLQFRHANELEGAFAATSRGKVVGLVLLRAWLMSFACWLFFVLIAVIDGVSSDSVNAASSVYGTGVLVSAVVFFLGLALPYRDHLSEWQLVVKDWAPLAVTAYGLIHRKLAEREAPVAIGSRAIRTGLLRYGSANPPPAPGGPVSHHMTVSPWADQRYVMYESVFPFGRDLYVGWSMWRNQSGYGVIGQYLRGIFIPPYADLRAVIRANQAKALRDEVHRCTREALHEAGAGGPRQLEELLPIQMIPRIEDLDAPVQPAVAPPVSTPAPAPVPPAEAPPLSPS
ncbi:MAG: hypothetical protein ACJ73S_27005 [Mycobacteriales bacterium]